MQHSFLQLYRQAIQEGTLHPDATQEKIVGALDAACFSYQKKNLCSFLERLMSFRLFSSGNTLQGIYLWGGVGRGKTTLLNLMLKALSPIPTHRIHTHLWIQQLQAQDLSPSRREKWAREFVSSTPILFLDEMEIMHIADGMVLHTALTSFWKAGGILLTTSNFPPDALYPKGLQRELLCPFFSQISSQCQVLSLENGKDYRMNIVSHTDVYFSPLSAMTNQKLSYWWNRLTSHALPTSRTLFFAGRSLTLSRTSENICWVTFDELCRAPLGITDYQEIMRVFPYVILSDIPRIEAKDQDALRRFIVLIDLLYESHHPTIFSAECAPENLVNSLRHVPLFLRTASRLEEMKFWIPA